MLRRLGTYWIGILIVTLSLTSCSLLEKVATDAVLGPDKGLSVDANVAKGDAEGEQSVAQNANTAVSVGANRESTEVFEGPVETVVNESPLGTFEIILIVLLAGWAIPSPSEMVNGLVRNLRHLGSLGTTKHN